jgi:large subunit ribosomal protein L22
VAAAAEQERQVVRAQAKYVRMTARKARLVTDHIRGRSVPEARTVLAFTQRAAAHEIEKVLRSAVANAEANNGLVGDDLVVLRAYVDEGPTMKRWRARARGRVARIHKRTCHITIELAEPVRTSTAPAAVAEPAEGKRRLPRRRKPAEDHVLGTPEPARKPRAPKEPVPMTWPADEAEPETTAETPETPEPEAPATEETED